MLNEDHYNSYQTYISSSDVSILEFPKRNFSLSKLHPKIEWQELEKYWQGGDGDTHEKSHLQHVVNRSISFFFNLQTLCENYNIPLKHFSMLDFFRGLGLHSAPTEKDKKLEFTKTVLNSPYLNVINDDFIGWPVKKELGGFNVWNKVNKNAGHRYRNGYWPTCISEKDLHPNAVGQELITEFLYKNITGK